MREWVHACVTVNDAEGIQYFFSYFTFSLAAPFHIFVTVCKRLHQHCVEWFWAVLRFVGGYGRSDGNETEGVQGLWSFCARRTCILGWHLHSHISGAVVNTWLQRSDYFKKGAQDYLYIHGDPEAPSWKITFMAVYHGLQSAWMCRRPYVADVKRHERLQLLGFSLSLFIIAILIISFRLSRLRERKSRKLYLGVLSGLAVLSYALSSHLGQSHLLHALDLNVRLAASATPLRQFLFVILVFLIYLLKSLALIGGSMTIWHTYIFLCTTSKMVYSNKWDSEVSSQVNTNFLYQNANCEDEVEDISSFSSCSSSITADLIASRNQSSQSPLQYDKNISENTDSDSSPRKMCPQYSSKATTRRGVNDLLDEFTALVVKVQTTGIRAASWEAGELLYDAVLTILIKHGA